MIPSVLKMNECGINAAKLPPVVVELILQNLLAEAHALTEMQIKAEAAQETEEATDGK